ncbi:Methyltransferase [Candidatus Burkholderia verschuerenii]|uniref:Methyltransferase n=1 Tax=Candidatus Burkholderia verschuerenii TaxID=242163 RepID=A0A0L0M9C8_9BURK|nr:class I SAM-dependent RNA methyltransferase [Candidatus Burkholderia verschuerenii]KND59272.1 Methyltransferase [Candidatus Burkholderia verschuerenii]
MSSPLLDWFAPCPRGLEAPLAAELDEIGDRHVDNAPVPSGALSVGAQVPGGVHFRGSWVAGMAANLHSRIASRVLLKIAQGQYRNEHDIYDLTHRQRWKQWFTPNQTMRVDLTAIKSPVKSLEFTTLRVKDAVCDRLREVAGARPSIDTAQPDVRVFAFLTANECTLYLDTSGEPLFKRGWRLDKGAAPLRENLAAGILRLTGWTPGTPLFDPMCGSGTFLAEAAQTALDIAPGMERRFGFEKLKPFQPMTWQKLREAAFQARNAAFAAQPDLNIFGSDISGDMLEKARANLNRAGIPRLMLKQLDERNMTPPTDAPGILIANPPYGERIEVRRRGPRGEIRDTGRFRREDEEAFERAQPDPADTEFFISLGNALKQRFPGWRAYVLTSDRKLPGLMRLRESTKTPLFNGALKCRLFRFDLIAGSVRNRPAGDQPAE